MKVSLLGTFWVARDGHSLGTFETDKTRALFAYLVVESRWPHRREALATMFWPEQPLVRARHNLRQTLYRIRQALREARQPTPYLLASFQDIQWNEDASYWLDVDVFDQALNMRQRHHPGSILLCPDCRTNLANAVQLYRGDFMNGFSLADSPDFEWWLLGKQEHYHRRIMMILAWLSHDSSERKAYDEAAAWAQAEIGIEPWRERAHRRLMRALALGGQRRAALKQYDRCRQLLAKEFGSGPSALTKQLRDDILNDTLTAKSDY